MNAFHGQQRVVQHRDEQPYHPHELDVDGGQEDRCLSTVSYMLLGNQDEGIYTSE